MNYFLRLNNDIKMEIIVKAVVNVDNSVLQIKPTKLLYIVTAIKHR